MEGVGCDSQSYLEDDIQSVDVYHFGGKFKELSTLGYGYYGAVKLVQRVSDKVFY